MAGTGAFLTASPRAHDDLIHWKKTCLWMAEAQRPSSALVVETRNFSLVGTKNFFPGVENFVSDSVEE